jgi:uncharacterized lipoprotein YajG
LGINSEIFHKTQKFTQMKKLFIVLAVASLGFTACNSESETKNETDTTVVTPVAPVTIDTTVTVDTTATVDTTKK